MESNRKRMIGELNRGREIADQLRTMLLDDASASLFTARGLVDKILHSFTHSLSILNTANSDSDEVNSQLLPPAGRKSEDSGESCRTPAPKDRRGCYKRRKTSETWTKETPSLFEDGHAWRKYGQKVILNSKHPRNYFRCTHKFDQGCQATKQVQKIQDDPEPLFKTTYHGRHTCKNMFKSNHHIIMDASNNDSSIIWSFGSSQLSEDHYDNSNAINGSSTISSIKQEIDKNIEFQENKSSPSSSSLLQEVKKYSDEDDNDNYFISTEQLRTSTLIEGMTPFSSASVHGDVISSDVYSCTASTHSSMEMDQMMVADLFLMNSLTTSIFKEGISNCL